VAGLARVFGSGAMTNSINDIEQAGVLLVTGSNTTETHPVLAAAIKRAVKHRGAKLIVADPRRIRLTQFAHIWLRQNPGTDTAWINSMLHAIINEDLLDHEFVDNHTSGLDRLREHVSKYTPEYAAGITGIPPEDLIKAARMYARAPAASILYTMGITQHTSGTGNVMALADLAMLCGNLGIPGGGVNPLRGQNNVQGACDMGALPDVYSGYQKVEVPENREKMARAWNVKSLPDKPGMKLTGMLAGSGENAVKALYVIGENPALSDPDAQHTRKALQDLEFLVVQDIFLTETASMADVVLPACSFAEKDGTFTNTERRVQRVRKAIEPVGHSRPDWMIIQDLASRFGFFMHYQSPQDIMQEIASVTPSYAGINYSRLEKKGLQWPCPHQDHPGTPILHSQGFAAGRAGFQCVEYTPPEETIDEAFPLWLTTGRSLYHYHTGSMTRKIRGLNALERECCLEVSPQDAHKAGLKDHDRVSVRSRRGEITTRVRISSAAVPGAVFIPFHFAEAAANVLTNPALDPVAGVPEYKVCAVRIGIVD